MKCTYCPNPQEPDLYGCCVPCFKARVILEMLEHDFDVLAFMNIDQETLLPLEFLLDNPDPPEEQ